MKDDLAFRQSKRLGHTRQHFNLMTALAEWAISDAGGSEKVFGKRPGVAEFTPTDLGAEGGKAVKANRQNLPEIQVFLESVLPNLKEINATEGRNILSMLKGEIPQDLQDSLSRTAAFRSLQGGYAGSPMSRAAKARDFGKTSIDLMLMGGNAAERWSNRARGEVSPFIVTTPMQAAQTERNNLYSQATQQFKFNTAAAPDPGAAGQFNLQTALGSQAMSFGLGSAAGAMGGSAQQPQQTNIPQQQYFAGNANNTGAGMGGWQWGTYWGGG